MPASGQPYTRAFCALHRRSFGIIPLVTCFASRTSWHTLSICMTYIWTGVTQNPYLYRSPIHTECKSWQCLSLCSMHARGSNIDAPPIACGKHACMSMDPERSALDGGRIHTRRHCQVGLSSYCGSVLTQLLEHKLESVLLGLDPLGQGLHFHHRALHRPQLCNSSPARDSRVRSICSANSN